MKQVGFLKAYLILIWYAHPFVSINISSNCRDYCCNYSYDAVFNQVYNAIESIEQVKDRYPRCLTFSECNGLGSHSQGYETTCTNCSYNRPRNHNGNNSLAECYIEPFYQRFGSFWMYDMKISLNLLRIGLYNLPFTPLTSLHTIDKRCNERTLYLVLRSKGNNSTLSQSEFQLLGDKITLSTSLNVKGTVNEQNSVHHLRHSCR
jgi:hypothetical protein